MEHFRRNYLSVFIERDFNKYQRRFRAVNWEQWERFYCLKRSTALGPAGGSTRCTGRRIVHLRALGYDAAKCLKINATT